MHRFIPTLIFLLGGSLAASAQSNGAYATVNGLNLYYEIHGSSRHNTDVPLVLIHGGGSTIETTFGRVWPTFAKEHQVIAVELQAHGHTGDRDGPLTFEQDADDVAALLQLLMIPKADLIGFSNGGTTALQIAIRHPLQVNKLVAASALVKRDGVDATFWAFMEKASIDNMPAELKTAYLNINPSAKSLQTMHDKDAARMRAFTDIAAAKIRDIQAPVMILAADGDVIRPEHAVALYRELPHATLVILPGSHGGYFGEITTIKPGKEQKYPAVQLIETFLAGAAEPH